MARQDEQDFRIDFIESIARTDNLRTLRNITSNMSRLTYFFRINKAELNDLVEDGVKTIKKLLGTSANSFAPINEMNNRSVQAYFERIVAGYKEKENISKNILSSEKKKEKIEEKLAKYKEKGKLDKCKELEKELECRVNPEVKEKEYLYLKEQCELSYSEKIIDLETYESAIKRFNHYLSIIADTKKDIARIKENSNALFLDNMQKQIRKFLCSSFFKKDEKISKSPNKFLTAYDGSSRIDFEHLLLLYNYLKSIKYKDIKRVEAVLYYYAVEQLYRDISSFLNKREFVGIIVKDSPTEFYSEKISGYSRKYMPYYLVPKGYRGYIFEPNNLAQQSFIAAINKENLSIDTMVGRYKDAQSFMKERKNGIFYKFLDKDIENRLLPVLLTEDFPLNEMNGEFKNIFLKEFEERRRTFGYSDSFTVMTDMYKRVVKPYMLEVLGSYVRVFCSNLTKLRDKEMIYIYYVSPQRIAIAVREDVTDEMLQEVFDKKFLEKLELIKTPELKDIVFGKYL